MDAGEGACYSKIWTCESKVFLRHRARWLAFSLASRWWQRCRTSMTQHNAAIIVVAPLYLRTWKLKITKVGFFRRHYALQGPRLARNTPPAPLTPKATRLSPSLSRTHQQHEKTLGYQNIRRPMNSDQAARPSEETKTHAEDARGPAACAFPGPARI